MYILRNAMKNIRNSPIRNLILGVIIVVVSLICCMSLSLLRISDKAEKEALLKTSVIAKVAKGDSADSIDVSNALTYSEIKKFADSEYVYDSYISVQEDMKIVEFSEDFTLVGYNSDMAAKYFLFVDEIVMVGAWCDSSNILNECIVTNIFSRTYDYEIGDVILSEINNQLHEFKIVGFYKGNELNKNDIITNLNALESIINVADQTNASSAFVFNDPDNIDPFREYVAQSSTDEVKYRALFSGVQKFREYFSPIKSTKNFAVLSLILSLLVGGSILIVLSIFNIQERKYEVGVLSAIGMPKKKIVFQFVSEILIITSFSVILGIAAGGPLSVTTARSMLSPKMYTGLTYSLRVSTGIQLEGMAGFNNIKIGYMPDENSDIDLQAIMNTQAKAVDKLKAVMNIKVILGVVGIGLLLTILSSLASIAFVVRFDPLNILNNVN